ncbi:FMN-dependent NADH-azoreductase [Asticcacaulis endophyticus]|uniref:FMN dependent NADH:quinone oxidoreductase n=1 Tax=Asticcacaulis endophyticus TaxID=1395890 RepID=A0A918PVZ1_9CAUL|nr:NAD(P)H-dependent oxidoreductase [Asticcacaulis endophyticus]GGZ25042.1 FMN-dependent NADH-azoreductase [Asticcacaulis endophyticus]
MSKVLIINSAATGDGSVSAQLTDAFKAKYAAANPLATFTEHDFGKAPLAPLSSLNIAGFAGTAGENPAEIALSQTSDALIAELEAADLLVIGSPMYNFGISALLKTWFDYVLRAGRTFRYTESGPEGLLKGKKAIIVLARGGLYSEGPLAAIDFQEGHIKTMLGFIGITDVTVVRAEKIAFGPEFKAEAIEAATAELLKLAA